MRILTGIMLALLTLSMIIVLTGKASSLSVTAQENSTATVYLNPPTINGTVIGEEFTVNVSIRDSPDIGGWQSGLAFNTTLLECTGFFEGEFLSDAAGPLGTQLLNGTIDNTRGVITAYSCTLLGKYYASGSGQLAYATFKVKATGVSDIHLRDVKLSCWILVDTTPEMVKIPTNIIDTYMVIVETTPCTVVTVSNSTGTELACGSGFSDHAFIPGYGISFNVTGPYPGFSNVTIPETLMWGLDAGWMVLIDGIPAGRTITYNGTHYSVYFTYSNLTHRIQITSPHAIPEFPTAIILPLFMFFTLIAVALTNKITMKKSKKT